MFVLANTPWALNAWSSFFGFVGSDGTMSRFTDAKVDAAMADLTVNGDPVAQEKDSFEIQNLLKDNAYFGSMYQINNMYAVNKDLDWTPNLIGLLTMENAHF